MNQMNFQTVKELKSLPGVGPYIAGAIGSIALGLDVPAVDRDHHRVLSRLFRDKGIETQCGQSQIKLFPKEEQVTLFRH